MQTKLLFSLVCLCLSSVPSSLAQGSPLPGGGDSTTMAPLPGAELRPANNVFPVETNQRLSAPVPQNPVPMQAPTPGQRTGRTAYGHLPLTVKDAKNRLVELRTALAVSRPQDLRDPIFQLSEWLGDSADAHNKLAAAFAKHEDMKAQYMGEKQIGVKFAQLKRDAQLLKADLLIAEKRYPEALAPLVDIVLADPTSGTGKTAYQRLKDLGFSHEADVPSAMTAPVAEAPLKPAPAEPASLASSTTVVTSVKAAVKPVKPSSSPRRLALDKPSSRTVIRANSGSARRRAH